MSNINENPLMKSDETKPKIKVARKEGEPTAAFKGASWAALVVGVSD